MHETLYLDPRYPPEEEYDPDEAPFEPDNEHEYGPPQQQKQCTQIRRYLTRK